MSGGPDSLLPEPRKRPCCICRRWFRPDAPMGARQLQPDPPQGATLRNGGLPRSPHSSGGRPSHAVGESPETSWKNCPPHALRGDLLGDEVRGPVEATFSALRPPTGEDKATSWPMPTALRCFAPGVPILVIIRDSQRLRDDGVGRFFDEREGGHPILWKVNFTRDGLQRRFWPSRARTRPRQCRRRERCVVGVRGAGGAAGDPDVEEELKTPDYSGGGVALSGAASPPVLRAWRM